jgi:proline iminopeptidase
MLQRTIYACAFLFSFLMMSCNPSPDKTAANTNDYFAPVDSGVQSGGVKMISIETPKGKFNVWTKRIGNNPTIKVLLLAGGPGATHEYLECFESFFPKEGIEFYYYDQLACGYSDDPKDTSLFSLDRYVEEVEQVRQALKLDTTNFYLFGHSWGGILAMQYAVKYQQHMKSLIISDMMPSAADYNKYASDVLAKQMDPLVLDTIRQLEAKGDFENPKYMELLLPNFYAQHLCRLDPWPEPLSRSMSKINQALYVSMQGPSEFGLRGKLTSWDVKPDLPSLTIPVLSIGAKYDTMDPEAMKWIAEHVKNGSYLYCPNGSHTCLYDDQQVYMTGLIKYIKAVDGGAKKVTL